jgi:hypothetical protein
MVALFRVNPKSEEYCAAFEFRHGGTHHALVS